MTDSSSPAPNPLASGTVPPHPRPRQSPLAWILVVVLATIAAVLATFLIVRSGDSGQQAQGFDTPERAIEFSTQQVAAGDAEGAMSAWSFASQAQNQSLESMIDRLATFMPADPVHGPSGDVYFEQLAEAGLAGGAARNYFSMATSLLLPEVEPDVMLMMDSSELSAQEINSRLNSGS